MEAKNDIFNGMNPSVQNEWKEKFEAYKKVQYGGRYNMVMEATAAAEEIGITMDDYWFIIKNYNALKAKFN